MQSLAGVEKEIQRFVKLSHARAARSTDELLALFGKLSKSTKFSEQAKPGCFSILLKRCCEESALPNERVFDALDVIGASGAIQCIGNCGELQERDAIVIRTFVIRLFRLVRKDEESVYQLFREVERCGLSKSRCETLDHLFVSAANPAGLNEDEIGYLCDLDWAALCRMQGNPVPEVILDSIANYRNQERTQEDDRAVEEVALEAMLRAGATAMGKRECSGSVSN